VLLGKNMKKIIKNSFWFTLVELIVVITIIAILWTIAFISLQWYSKNARDSVRIADVQSLVKSLSLFEIKTWIFPEPSNWTSVSFSWWEIWTQWTIWDSVIVNIGQLSKKVLDPSTESEYTYSRLNTKKEYQIAAVIEGDLWINSSPHFSSVTHAAWTNPWIAYVKWNYNWMLAKVQTWAVTYVLAVPTIISWDISVTDIINLQQSNKLVYNGKNNLPASYESSKFKVDGGWFVFNPSDIVVYIWSTSTLTAVDNQLSLMSNTQNVYSGTDVSGLDSQIDKLVDISVDLNSPTDEAKEFAGYIVKNSVNPGVEINISTSSQESVICWGWDYNSAYNVNLWYFNGRTIPNRAAFVALKPDGSIVAWWDDSYGWSWALAPSGSGYEKIYSSEKAFAALKSDGTISVWWDADNGWTGGPIDNWYVDISSTLNAFAALKDDGTISVWWPSWTSAWDQANAPSTWDYTKIYAGKYTFSALKDDGTVYAWWSYVTNWPVAGVWYTSISASQSAFAGLHEDGSISTWWEGGYGWIWWPIDNWYISIASTQRAFAALKSDGSLSAWWADSYGWTGTLVGPFTSVSATENAFAALKTDGSIETWWGSGNWWTGGPVWTWYTKIYANNYGFAALKNDGTIYAWWSSSYGWIWDVAWTWYVKIFGNNYGFVALRSDGTVYGWGSGGSGYPVDSWYINIMATANAFAAIKDDGSMSLWGSQYYWATGGPNDSWYTSLNWTCK